MTDIADRSQLGRVSIFIKHKHIHSFLFSHISVPKKHTNNSGSNQRYPKLFKIFLAQAAMQPGAVLTFLQPQT